MHTTVIPSPEEEEKREELNVILGSIVISKKKNALLPSIQEICFITSIKHYEEVLIMIIRQGKETRLETSKIVFLDVIKVLRKNFNKFAA